MKIFLHYKWPLFFFLIGYNSWILPAQSFEWEWAKKFGGGNDCAYSISIDSMDNYYVCGAFTNFGHFGDTIIPSQGEKDIFLMKFDCNHQMIWVRTAGGIADDRGMGMDIDDEGNIYLTGDFEETAIFDTFQISSHGMRDMFIAKYNANGSVEWVQGMGGVSEDMSRDVVVTSDNHLVQVGYFSYTVHFQGYTLVSHGINDIFLAKYDTSGSLVWIKTAGGSCDDDLEMALDPDDNIILNGRFECNTIYEDDTLYAIGGRDILVMKYNINGDLLWIRHEGGPEDDSGHGVTTDNHSNVYSAGYFSNLSYFGSFPMISYGYRDAYLAKYDSSGQLQWVKRNGGFWDDENLFPCSGNENMIINAGYFEDNALFGDSLYLSSNGMSDICVTAYNSDGEFLWVQTAGGFYDDFSYNIKQMKCGTILIAGSFTDEAFFGSHKVIAYGAYNAFIAALDDEFNAVIPTGKIPGFSVTPNPCKSFITISSTKKISSPVILNIFNSTGMKVREHSLFSFPINIDFLNMAPGMYFISLNTPEKAELFKIVKLSE